MPHYRPVEIWTRDPEDKDLWHGAHGVIVNTAALEEREHYFSIQRRQGRLEPRLSKPIVAYPG